MGASPTAAPALEFWFDFASTYSYPAAMVVEDRARETGVPLSWQPFLLGPIFADFGWDTSPFNLHPLKGAYMWRDMERICAALDLPFRPPDRFPQNSVMAARIALAERAMPHGPAFCRAVYRATFGASIALDDRAALLDVLADVGGDPDRVLAILDDPAQRPDLRAQVEAARRHGLFGAPTFRIGTEIFWGFDRLDMALDHARSIRCGNAPGATGIDR